MDEPAPVALDGLTVAVEESPDALAYTFTAVGAAASRPGFPYMLLFPLVFIPAGMLAVVAAAHAQAPNRPAWEEILTGLFAAQVLAWLVAGLIESAVLLRWYFRRPASTLRFTREGVRFARDRVCDLEEVRGLRLFTYPSVSDPVAVEGCLSLVVGEGGGTHLLLGGYRREQLRALADDIHRRLAAFRTEQGIVSPLEPVAEVATTADEGGDLAHTRPPSGFLPFAGRAFALLQNRWAGSMWCLVMFAGLFASGRMILAAGFQTVALFAHILAAFIHVGLLASVWDTDDASETAELKDKSE